MELLSQLLKNTSGTYYELQFLGSEQCSHFDDAAIAVLPVPYDGTSTYHKGADRGPEALLKASAQLECFDIETRTEVYKRGILTLHPLILDEGPEVLHQRVEQAVREIYQAGKFPVVLGGEHTVTTGAVAASFSQYRTLSVLQLDAHGDIRETYQGSSYNHACVMARVREYCPFVQVGIRSIDSSEISQMDLARVFFAHEIHEQDSLLWQENVSGLLSEEVYVTVDLDCFDSSIMPSTGTPEPGGLTWHQVMTLLKRIAENHHVVGFDVVELLPRPTNPAPDFLAAKLVYQFLSYVFTRQDKGT